ncbi:MAG: hypothetical protein J6X17_09800 [Lachnospiraceae bacterium]|nr:hypothetical protein [Lachnospiraceae bacterium]
MSRNKKGLICIAAAAVLITAGLLLKQNAAVLAKAIRVCLECIGVG